MRVTLRVRPPRMTIDVRVGRQQIFKGGKNEVGACAESSALVTAAVWWLMHAWAWGRCCCCECSLLSFENQRRLKRSGTHHLLVAAKYNRQNRTENLLRMYHVVFFTEAPPSDTTYEIQHFNGPLSASISGDPLETALLAHTRPD